MRLSILIALLTSASCVSSHAVECDGRICPEGTTCVELAQSAGDPHLCVDPAAVSACSGVAALDGCTTQTVSVGACYATTSGEVCLEAGCGNGLVDTGEVCDDGNANIGDGCSAACSSTEVCGNGIVDAVTLDAGGNLVANEACDDGNGLGHDGCTSSCVDEQATWSERDTGDPFDPGKATPRLEAPLVYDTLRRRIVLFGGVTRNRRVACDVCTDPAPVPQAGTWESDGTTWVNMEPPDEPTSRVGAAMAYDAARTVSVMFGGSDGTPKNDTWQWNGIAWSQTAPATSPPARYRHGMAYDAKRKVVVMFGGRGADDALLADTWEWDGATWHAVSTVASPTPEEALAMTYDPVRGVIVMIGMDASYAWATWEYDGTAWTQKATNDVTPEVTSLAFDVQSGHVLAYGFLAAIADATYSWDGATWTQVGTNDAGSYTGASIVSDQAGHVHLFGGETVSCGGPGVCYATAQNETWAWNGSTWQEQLVEQPSPRRGARAALDAANGTIVMVGGRYIDNAYTETDYRETWEYDGFHWTLFADGPWTAGHYGAAIAYDTHRDEIVVFGGAPFAGSPPSSAVAGQTWIRKNRIWTKATPSTSPDELVDAAMAYDPDHQQVVLFGGEDGKITGGSSDTWLWNGADWNKAQPAQSPSVRVGAALAWDPIAREIVLFGGESNSTALQDTWTWNGSTWTRHAVDSAPPPRGHAQLSWNASRHALVLFGGETSEFSPLADTWEWSAGAWHRVVAVTSPPVRTDHAQAPLPDGTGLFVFGGVVPSAASATGLIDLFDVWDLRWQASTRYEICEQHLDHDGDGLSGCDDPDCWSRCTPSCPPGSTCDPAAPHCGDNQCNAAIEDCRTCPQDCATCTSACGDGLCDPSETTAACPGDCPP